MEGKPIETIGTVKHVASSLSSANMPSMRLSQGGMSDDAQLEDGGKYLAILSAYTHSIFNLF